MNYNTKYKAYTTCPNCKAQRLLQAKKPTRPTWYYYVCEHCGHSWSELIPGTLYELEKCYDFETSNTATNTTRQIN